MTHTAGHVQKMNTRLSNPILISSQLPSERRDRPKARENVRCCQNRVAQSCLTLCGPLDCSPPSSSGHGTFQATILERVAISYSRGSSQTRNQTRVS